MASSKRMSKEVCKLRKKQRNDDDDNNKSIEIPEEVDYYLEILLDDHCLEFS
jgi:hypothetical protein